MYGAVYDTVSADALAESATEATLTARYNAAANDLNEFKRRREVVAPHARSVHSPHLVDRRRHGRV